MIAARQVEAGLDGVQPWVAYPGSGLARLVGTGQQRTERLGPRRASGHAGTRDPILRRPPRAALGILVRDPPSRAACELNRGLTVHGPSVALREPVWSEVRSYDKLLTNSAAIR